jgi:hypothetical protein
MVNGRSDPSEVTIQEGQVQGTLSLEDNQMHTAEKYIACPQLGWELSNDYIIKTFWQLVLRLGQIEHGTTCANTSSDGNYCRARLRVNTKKITPHRTLECSKLKN